MRPVLVLWCLLAAGCAGDDARLESLERRVAQLEIENAQMREQLDEARSDLEALKKPVGSSSAGRSVTRPEWLHEEEDGSHLVLRDAFTADLDSLSRQVRAIPHRGADGEMDGYRISGIRRGSSMDLLGFKNGDIVHSINGHTVVGVSEAMEAYEAVRDADRITVAVTRRGIPATVEVTVR